MPALRLKTKLVFAITAMVVVIVATLAALYISEVVHQRIQEAADLSHIIGLQIYSVSRGAFASGPEQFQGEPQRSLQIEQAWQEMLQTDWVVNSLLESVQRRFKAHLRCGDR